MSKYITRPGIYVMLFSEELQMLKRYQLIHPHCLPESSGSFSAVALREIGENQKVMTHPYNRVCALAAVPGTCPLCMRLILHSHCTSGKLRPGRWGNQQDREERRAPCGLCLCPPWLRMWRERCCLVIRTWDKKQVGEGVVKWGSEAWGHLRSAADRQANTCL